MLQAPETISQVRLFVNELRRISLLWDELWLGTLNQHHSDISRRVSQLDDEIARVNTNSHLNNSEKDYLISEKYMVLMKPVSSNKVDEPIFYYVLINLIILNTLLRRISVVFCGIRDGVFCISRPVCR